MRPLPLPPTPPMPVQESADTLDKAYSEIALYSPSSPPFHIKASSLSLDDQESYYENVNQYNKADTSLTGPPLPSPTNKCQQGTDEYPKRLSSSSDDPGSAENQGQDYVSMAGYDIGATESSWHSSF